MDYDKDIIEYLQSHPEETKFSETLEIVVKSIPGAMEKLKSIDVYEKQLHKTHPWII